MTKYCEYCGDDGHTVPATKYLEDLRRMIPVCDRCYDLAGNHAACSDPDCEDCRRGVVALGVKVEA